MLGVSAETVGAWERGRGVDRAALALIAAATDAPMEWLIAGLSPARYEAFFAAACPDRACPLVEPPERRSGEDRLKARRVPTDEALPPSCASALNLRPEASTASSGADASPGTASARPTARFLDLGGATLVSGGRAPAYRLNQSIPAAADARILLSLVVHGRRGVAQAGRAHEGGPGSAVFVSDNDDGRLTYRPDGRYVSVFLPMGDLLARAPQAGARLSQPIPPGSPPLRLLGAYVSALMRSEDGVDPDLAPSIAEHFVDLCALLLGATGGQRELAERRGVREAQRYVAARAIDDGAAAPDFSALTVARRLGVAESHVYDLFRDTGAWFWDRVNARRIEVARQRLVDPRFDRMTVAELAFACGFTDFAQFDRLFAARYGGPPSAFRARKM